jgi:hypothetical protein
MFRRILLKNTCTYSIDTDTTSNFLPHVSAAPGIIREYTHQYIKPFKDEVYLFYIRTQCLRAVNTLHFGYKNQSLNVL